MHKHKLIILSFALILVFGLIGQSFINAPSAYAQTGGGDSDGDGLPDYDDGCPNQPGPKSNKGCPVKDNNNKDSNDNNNTSSDSNEPPPPDSDGDGTADPLDRCPDEPGDGANYGCPEGRDGSEQTASSPEQPTINLIAMPTDGECVVSPKGTSHVNIRAYPLVGAPVVGTLEVNEIAEVLAILHDGTVRAETEHATNELGPMLLPPQPDPDDDFPTWALIQDSNTDVIGWVAEAVVRFGGDCSEFEKPDTDEPYLAIKLKPAFVSSYQTGGNAAADSNHDKWINLLSIEWGEGEDNPFMIDILVIPTDGGDPIPMDLFSLNFTPIKYEYNPSTGGMSLTFGQEEYGPTIKSNDDGTKTVEYCVYEEVHEVGVFEEVCYEIEIPEGCELVSAETGVYTLDCDGDEITVNPAIQGMDMLSSPDFENVVFPKTGDDGTTTVEYCIYQEVHEAGVFEEVCYEIEIPEGCELVSAEAGVYTLDCEDDEITVNPNLLGVNMFSSANFDEPIINTNDDGTTTVEYCIYQEVHEAGVFEEVCYEIEVPEGCELVSAESGVYTLDCEGDEISLNPALQGMGMLSSPDFEPPVLPEINHKDDGTTTVEYCVYEEVHEAGVFEEVCYEIEIPEGCELVSAEAGVYNLDCEGDDVVVNPAIQGMDMFQSPTLPEPIPHTVNTNDDGSTTVEYCIYQEVHEAGIFEEVCYEIEVPENCTLVSSEAGVYDIECQGEAEVSINPALVGLPAASIVAPEDPDDGPLVGLLLPAVQAAR